MKASFESLISVICMALLGIGSLCGFAYGYIQNLRTKKEREKKTDTLMRSAHALAKEESEAKSIDELMSDRAKRFGGTSGSKTKEE